MATAKKTSTPTAEKRPRGRPPVPANAHAVVGSIRLTQDQWDKLGTLGGPAWLREKIDRAKLPAA